MELESRNNSTDRIEPDELVHFHEGRQLPPVDGGKDAWMFLVAGFIIEGLTWGFAFSYGVFQDYYLSSDEFRNSGNIAAIGTCALGIAYLSAPLDFALLLGVPRFRRLATPVGFLVMCLALALSSFSTTTTHLILSQGVGYGLGAGLAYSPVILWMGEWFVKRRGLAFGTMWAGTGLSGVVFPIVLQWMLKEYGFRTTLRVWSVLLMILIAPVIYFVKPRIPTSQTASKIRPFDLSFIWTRSFMIYQVCNTVEALGFFLPAVYLPSQARSLGVTGPLASLTVILFNLASIGGCVVMGMLVDKHHATTCILLSSVGTALSVFLIWGFSVSIAPLYVFCIVYGLFAGSFTSTWTAITRETQKNNERADMSMIFGILETGRGIGNIASGFLSEALIAHGASISAYAFGSTYGNIIIFTGVTALFGGACALARPLKLL
ncbi:hypothetical protein N7499_012279 [Penicillium canescens]|uniref:Major facilitator superfamily (MFS) profile domain-containing protein n=1 Tax=Penicillium canescens TaxID=5083 RepID=A0AAD6N431_PENCN|nr:uncharacterized protein N7446_001074 [Penicillium canescens]KAJ6013115.1 hypothetical protein N7522_003470 [Penicillium canescens]KAJ6029863.1 hypothetical protein N7460_010129 [Penicillium canescens]KAJ6060245.1 hypothetical protein N7444_002099 [Penicillium canescens]KAJ6063599.1 hypothetical protein N7499_012279 [Penicillium canescens]KAJ6078138.1 hypothetical protein N7446_001074 [Penicillium canescens]